MLHANFCGNRPAGSGEERFWRIFTIYGRGGHLGHVTKLLPTNFRVPYPMRFHIKFGFDWPSGFREDIEIVNDDDGRRRQSDAVPWVYYKLTYEPSAQVS